MNTDFVRYYRYNNNNNNNNFFYCYFCSYWIIYNIFWVYFIHIKIMFPRKMNRCVLWEGRVIFIRPLNIFFIWLMSTIWVHWVFCLIMHSILFIIWFRRYVRIIFTVWIMKSHCNTEERIPRHRWDTEIRTYCRQHIIWTVKIETQPKKCNK